MPKKGQKCRKQHEYIVLQGVEKLFWFDLHNKAGRPFMSSRIYQFARNRDRAARRMSKRMGNIAIFREELYERVPYVSRRKAATAS